jgi:CRP-like cAMP-binding protein
LIGTGSFFTDLSPEDQQSVRRQCTHRRAANKEVIVHQGSRDREMYIVVSGRLRVAAISDEGKEVSFGVLEADDTFGEMSMLDAEPRSATVTAIEPCELLVLNRAGFEAMVAEHPHIAINLLVILAQRLRHTTRVYEDAVFLEVPARLAKFLLHFSKQESGPADSSRVLDFKLSQYELGTLINASRESVNKQLRDWEARGIIESKRGRIRVLDPDALEEQAQSLE